MIEQGKHYVQYQLNNPKRDSKGVPYSLMGHGLQLAAKHLGIADKHWQTAYFKDRRAELQKMRHETGISVKINNPRKPKA